MAATLTLRLRLKSSPFLPSRFGDPWRLVSFKYCRGLSALDFLSLVDAMQPGAFRSADVDEHVFAAVIRLDEAKTFLAVKPLLRFLASRNPSLPRSWNNWTAEHELPASLQSVMPLASEQDRETSGRSRTQADLSHLDRRMTPRLFAATGSVYYVRLQP